MPGPGRNSDEIKNPNLSHGIADQAMSLSSQDYDGMGMGMPFECREAVRCHFKVTQFAFEVLIRKKYLTRNGLEGRQSFLLVRHTLNPFPGVILSRVPYVHFVFPAHNDFQNISCLELLVIRGKHGQLS
jgi:hypothetical protein